MWLLSNESAAEVARVLRSPISPTAEQLQAFHARQRRTGTSAGSDESSILRIAGSVAEIRIEGVLMKEASFLMWLFGMAQTAYKDITAALAQAGSDPAIKSVALHVNSPGGKIDGLFDTLAAIQAFTKPISVQVEQACSAAYAIAAVAGKITATSVAASVGSIGIVASFVVDEEVVELTSTEAPEKRPDLTTEAGKAVVVKYLDAIHDLFVDAIAAGRDVTAKEVNAEYGRGSTLLAGEAKKRGMIDAIAKPQLRSVPGRAAASADEAHAQPRAVGDEQPSAGAEGAASTERKRMDLNTLRAQHPELLAEHAREVLAAERDRVGAHLTMGETSGDLRTALGAVRDGSAMTQTLMAQYMAAGMNRSDRRTRQEESDAAGEAVDGANPGTKKSSDANAEKPDLGDLVAAKMLEERGKKPKGDK
jgi:ClpP class serine protease